MTEVPLELALDVMIMGVMLIGKSSNLEVVGLGRIELPVVGTSAKNIGVAIRRSKIRRRRGNGSSAASLDGLILLEQEGSGSQRKPADRGHG